MNIVLNGIYSQNINNKIINLQYCKVGDSKGNKLYKSIATGEYYCFNCKDKTWKKYILDTDSYTYNLEKVSSEILFCIP